MPSYYYIIPTVVILLYIILVTVLSVVSSEKLKEIHELENTNCTNTDYKYTVHSNLISSNYNTICDIGGEKNYEFQVSISGLEEAFQKCNDSTCCEFFIYDYTGNTMSVTNEIGSNTSYITDVYRKVKGYEI